MTETNDGPITPADLRTVGRCGQRCPTIATSGYGPVCALPAGHTGWHKSDEGTEWNPVTPGEFREVTETRRAAGDVPEAAVTAVAQALHREYCPAALEDHSPAALEACVQHRMDQARRVVDSVAGLLIQAGREQAARDIEADMAGVTSGMRGWIREVMARCVRVTRGDQPARFTPAVVVPPDQKEAYDRAAIAGILDALGPDTQDGDDR